jgi:large subunit ribosomal protein L33
MAKDGPRITILLRSSAGTGFTYASTKNRRTTTTKLELRKYDPVVRRHVLFRRSRHDPHRQEPGCPHPHPILVACSP